MSVLKRPPREHGHRNANPGGGLPATTVRERHDDDHPGEDTRRAHRSAPPPKRQNAAATDVGELTGEARAIKWMLGVLVATTAGLYAVLLQTAFRA